jgi:hypothetical protein
MLDYLRCAGQGYEVHVIVDGVSSQRLGDRAVAIQVLDWRHILLHKTRIVHRDCCLGTDGGFHLLAQRLAQSGAFLSTQEMALFQMAGHSKVTRVLPAPARHNADCNSIDTEDSDLQ